MTGNQLIEIFKQGTRRWHLIGSLENGIIAGLDLEGRLYTICDGEVISKVNPDAIISITTRDAYLNPGGDGLWPAPEGTCLGYEYSTGEWRVPPGVTGSRFKVVERKENHAVIEAEVDLINASGLGVSTIFRRDVTVKTTKEFLSVKTIETIQYIGTRSLSNEQCLLAPWSLCQFDCGDGTEVVFPEINSSEIWDMYEPSDSHRYLTNGLWHIVADGSLRYQVGLSSKVPWIKLYLPHQEMEITRIAERLTADQKYIDIVDADPAKSPSDKGVCYSVYCDTDKFMEIEAAGGCPDILKPGSKLSLEIITEYRGT